MAGALPIYLDYASTTPIDEAVLNAMLPYFTKHYGNASSKTHAYGWISEEAIEIAREEIAALINASKEEIIFTSGATESINLALRGMTDPFSSQKNHIISFATEHRAVLDTLHELEKKGYDINLLPVDINGQVNLETLHNAIREETLLICCMYANNETGVIHPISKIGTIAKSKNVFFFCDASQAVGKIPVNIQTDHIDMMAFSSHKIYGPKGVGALYVRRKNPRVMLTPQITGGGQERNIRSGTLNVPGIVGFGKAASLCMRQMDEESKRLAALRDLLENDCKKSMKICIHGANTTRLPNISNICLKEYRGSSLIPDLCNKIAISSGSACNSGNSEGSHVLKAMGIEKDDIKKTIRISIGRMTTEEDIVQAIGQIGLINNS
jgi:cysteine desulfurase